ncbi:MAG: hypothetical protein KC620_10920 [Myxococcales bacterium]|nr:hypothetical protein [Myxococcales bacterium]
MRCLMACLAISFCLACGDDDASDAADAAPVDQVAEGCKHLEYGPNVEVNADPAEDTMIMTVHQRYDLTLASGADGNVGRLTFHSEGGEHYLFLDRDVPLALTDSTGATVEPMHVHHMPASCAQAATVMHVMFPQGMYVFDFGPTSETMLQMAVHRPVTDSSDPHMHSSHE